jgi:hypothetical protein
LTIPIQPSNFIQDYKLYFPGGKMRAFSFFLIMTIFVFAIAGQAMSASTGWAGPNDLTMQRESPVIDQGLAGYLAAQSPDTKTAVLVFFTDKAIFDRTNYNQALNVQESNLIPAARERRLKTRGRNNLVDFRDLPLNQNYVDQVLSTGAGIRQALRWFNAVSVNATAEQVNMIAGLPSVRFIKKVAAFRDDNIIPPSPSFARPDNAMVTLDYGLSANQLNQINVISAHELGFKGQGVIICMMDVGYHWHHIAFRSIVDSGRLLAQYDFINHDTNTDYDPSQDIQGQADHGTYTWSTLGGESSGNLYGPSYLASFVLAKTEDIRSEHHIEEDNWAAGAQWADSLGASVISSSLGYRVFDPPDTSYGYQDLNGHTTIVTRAAQLAALNGIIVCDAMGNSGTDGAGSLIAPADADSILSCGAVDAGGVIAYFSSLGPTYDDRIKPEVCAQGQGTVCADPSDTLGFTTASGTSLSTPLVGGSSGVVLSAHPNWTPVMVREALMMTADRFDSPGNTYGWGIMDVARALYYHPQGDIIVATTPVITAPANSPILISATITSRNGQSISDAHLFYRAGTTGDFTEIGMTAGNNNNWSQNIPAQSGAVAQYYFKAVDIDSSYAYNPVGGPQHPYTVSIGSLQFTDSFEDGPINWTSGGTNNFWGMTAKYAHTGNLSITDSPGGNYRSNTNSWIQTAFALDLSHATSAAFSFWWRGILQSGHDTIFVEGSSDGGNTWNRFPQFLSGTLTVFTQVIPDLSPYFGHADVRLRFRLYSDASTNREGMYIDDVSINWVATGINDNPIATPVAFALNQNYPNPFNPSTVISFSLKEKGLVNISVFDLLGRHVKTLAASEMSSGAHEVIWNGSDDAGREVASGVYLYNLNASGQSQVRRMTLLR